MREYQRQAACIKPEALFESRLRCRAEGMDIERNVKAERGKAERKRIFTIYRVLDVTTSLRVSSAP